MNGQDRTFYKRRKSLTNRLGMPWLKMGILIILIIGIIIRGLGWMKPDGGFNVENSKIPLLPMAKHPKVPILTIKDVGDKKLVALTFDDGPSAKTTPRLLDILKDNGVNATFFVLGGPAKNNPEIIKREEAEGHEVATHTISHAQMSKMSSSEIKNDLSASEDVLEGILGHGPSLLRPPYGDVNDKVKKTVDLPMILWSVDTLDWKNKNTESILKNTESEIYDGGIILMHDIHETSVDAVGELINMLKEDNYEFVTVSQLANLRKRNLEAGVVYGSFR